MAIGRTVRRHARIYINGYDLSAYVGSLDNLPLEYDEAKYTCLTDEVAGILPNTPQMGIQEVRGALDNTATNGMHVLFSSPGVSLNYMIPIGIRSAPNYGDPCYIGRQYQASYHSEDDGGAQLVVLKLLPWDVANLVSYDNPWGVLLLEKSAITGVNSTEYVDGLAATSKGGFMAYQVFAASGAGHTATIKVQHSTTTNDGDFVDLGGCTTGVIDVGTAPVSGIMQTTALTTQIRRYTRWQVTLGTATSVTLALALVRGK